MFRTAIAVVAALVACAGLALIVHGQLMGGWQMLAGGLIVLVGVLFERWRYRQPAERPDSSWQATGERFIDPSTGDPVEVFYDPRSGERRYVTQKQTPPP